MEFLIMDAKTARSGRSFKDTETQKRVRTHVMLEFRRRQRDGSNNSTQSRAIRAVRPAPVDCREVRSYNLQTPLNHSLGSHTTCGNRRKASAKARRACSSDVAIIPAAASLRAMYRSPDAWPSFSLSSSSSSPLELDQSIALAISYYQCKVPGLTADQAFITLNAVANNQQALSDLPDDRSSLATLDSSSYKGTIKLHLSAVCLASIGCMLQEPSMQTAGGLHRLFKAVVLEGIRTRLSDATTATSRATLGALFGLTSFEIACGSPEAIVHLRGIARMLDIAGSEIQYEGYGGGLRKVLEFIDLFHGVKTGMEPVYSTSWPTSSSNVPMYESVLNVPATDRGPAYQWAQQKVQTGRDADVEAFDSDPCDAIDLSVKTPSSSPTNTQASEAINDSPQQLVHQWKRRFLTVSRSDRATEQTAKACRLATRLLDGHSKHLALDLSTHLCLTGEGAWAGLRNTQLRLILLASSNANNEMQQALFATAYRRMALLKVSDWMVMKKIIYESFEVRSGLSLQ